MTYFVDWSTKKRDLRLQAPGMCSDIIIFTWIFFVGKSFELFYPKLVSLSWKNYLTVVRGEPFGNLHRKSSKSQIVTTFTVLILHRNDLIFFQVFIIWALIVKTIEFETFTYSQISQRWLIFFVPQKKTKILSFLPNDQYFHLNLFLRLFIWPLSPETCQFE